MNIDASVSLAKALADRSRLLILQNLRPGPRAVEEIAEALGLAPSTVSFHLKKLAAAGLVRNRRDQYYALYSLVPETLSLTLDRLVAGDADDVSVQAEREAHDRRRVLANFFPHGRLLKMPAQKRKRRFVLERFAALFREGRAYREAEVDALITPLFADHCLVRRMLVDEGFLTRAGSVYRRPVTGDDGTIPTHHAAPRPDDATMTHTHTTPPPDDHQRTDMNDRKKLLKQRYKLEGRTPGIFRVRNLKTGKAFLGSTLDLNGPLNRIRFQLELGNYRNPELQADYTRLGPEAFAFEVLDQVEPEGRSSVDLEADLGELEAKWAPTLDPTNTYNTTERLRFP